MAELRQQVAVLEEKIQCAVTCLNEALPLPANKGGAIKEKVKDALGALGTE